MVFAAMTGFMSKNAIIGRRGTAFGMEEDVVSTIRQTDGLVTTRTPASLPFPGLFAIRLAKGPFAVNDADPLSLPHFGLFHLPEL
jgi:hypothetical protein